MRLVMHHPFIITPRLLPGLRIADAFISITYARQPARRGVRYEYHIDTPGHEYSAYDLESGMFGGTLVEGMDSLLAFLGACAESVRYCGDNSDPDSNASLFPKEIAEWAANHSNDIDCARCEISDDSGRPLNHLIAHEN